MKKLLAVLFLLCPMIASAQDVIVKKDGSTIVCRVEKVGETDVTYKPWSDLKGSSYIMDKSLVSAINYESGKKETFSETTSLYTPSNQNDGVQAMNDRALLKMDLAASGNTDKKIKKLKTWGWIGTAVAAGGISLVILTAVASEGFYRSHNTDALYASGAVLFAAGAGTSIYCFIKAHKLNKEINALEYSSLYRYDIPFSNGSSLSLGADMLHDRIMDKRTVGLGLSYNF